MNLQKTADLHFNILFCGSLDVVSTFQLCWSRKTGVSEISDVELQTQIFMETANSMVTVDLAFEGKKGIFAPSWD